MENTPERLSSLWTIFYKFVFPPLWVGGFTLGAGSLWVSLFLAKSDGPPLGVAFGATTVLLAVSAYIYWSCCRLKRVRIDSRNLFISNYFHEIQVPLAEVEDVTEWRWDNTHPVTIHFIRPTEFGNKVIFMPKLRMFGFWSSHPVVDQILSAVDPSHIRLS
jgi:hypothetical protein